eukprot:2021858-Prymnesium_polylepis.2
MYRRWVFGLFGVGCFSTSSRTERCLLASSDPALAPGDGRTDGRLTGSQLQQVCGWVVPSIPSQQCGAMHHVHITSYALAACCAHHAHNRVSMLGEIR